MSGTDKFVINPYDVNGDYFARFTKESIVRYRLVDGKYVENQYGNYKKDGDKYVELEEEEYGEYVYFPSKVRITLADGETTKDVPVTWDFSGVTVTYEGGDFKAVAIINENGDFDFARDGETKNELGTQKIKVDVTVKNGKAKSIAVETEFKKLPGYIGGTNDGVDDFINPYNYIVPSMPKTLTVNLEEGTKTYTVGAKTNSLTWSFANFRPSYQGGVTKITAILVGEDGNAQKFDVNFLVYKMTVSHIESTGTRSTVANYRLNTDVTSGHADSNYTIDPYAGLSLALPTAYSVIFSSYEPVASDGKFTGEFVVNTANTGINTKSFSYAIVTMPTNLTYSVTEGGTISSSSGLKATIQFSNQERISVTLEVTEKAYCGTKSPTANASTLQVKIDGVPVAWYGTANVYDAGGTNVVATYNVVFTSYSNETSATMTTPSIKGRKIVYVLRPAVGVVVNKNSTVVKTKTQNFLDEPAEQRTKTVSGKKLSLMLGDSATIPAAQYYGNTVTITVTG